MHGNILHTRYPVIGAKMLPHLVDLVGKGKMTGMKRRTDHGRMTLAACGAHLIGVARLHNQPMMGQFLGRCSSITAMTPSTGQLMRWINLHSSMTVATADIVDTVLVHGRKAGLRRHFGMRDLRRPPSRVPEKQKESREQAIHNLDTVA